MTAWRGVIARVSAAWGLWVFAATPLQGQTETIPLTPDRWTATDSLRFETYLGRPSLYIDRGVALANGVSLRDGVLEFDVAATPLTTFFGVAFRASAHDFAEIIFFRPGLSGSTEAIQYGPALNGLGAAWQVFHGPGATAAAELPRETWMPVRIELAGEQARLYLNNAADPVLTVPRLAGTEGTAVGVWTGLFGRGAYFSNFRYTGVEPVEAAPVDLPSGILAEWQLSEPIDAAATVPGTLPDLSTLRWAPVRPEADGVVLINRYHRAPVAGIPFDPATRIIDVDSVMGGQVAGTKVVFAKTTIDADRAMFRRMQFSYSDGVVIYVNGNPLFFGVNAQFFRGDGVMDRIGDAVYLPLREGRNEIVLAVTEYTGGWAFRAQLDALPR